MIGVKITVLLIVLTIIAKVFVGVLVNSEDLETKLRMAAGTEVKWYTVAFAVLVIADAIGIVYSVVYLLFLR